MIKNKLKVLLIELKKFNIRTILVLDYSGVLNTKGVGGRGLNNWGTGGRKSLKLLISEGLLLNEEGVGKYN